LARIVAVAGVAAAAATIPFAGSAAAAPSSDMVPGTPCHIGSAACVQLGPSGFNGKAWFIRDHKVVKGPIAVATGGPGEDTTPGKFPVVSKDADHVSSETTDSEGKPSEMPYSVFFGRKGEAFHGGGVPTNRTAGCVRLRDSDASYFFNNLQKGDTVEVVSKNAPIAGGGSAPESDNNNNNNNDNNNNNHEDNNNVDKGLGGLLGGF
jgi:hypothetical protein